MGKVRIFRIGGLEDDGTCSYGPWLAEGISCPVKAGDYWPAADYQALEAEVKRLTKCLKTANSNHEKFERLWYLEQAKLAALVVAARWYEEKAVSINRYLQDKKTDAVMAVVTELSLDCGNKLKAAIAAAEGKP